VTGRSQAATLASQASHTHTRARARTHARARQRVAATWRPTDALSCSQLALKQLRHRLALACTQVLLSRALALLQLEDPALLPAALTDAEAVVRLQPRWFKGWATQARALLGLGHFVEVRGSGGPTVQT
jgi:hypothetical protein